MKAKTVKPSRWTKPEVRRLGKIEDVAGQVGTQTQGQPNRS